MASAVFAQTEAKDSIKAVIKAKKAQDAADLKAFKAKQKEELASFIEAQKSGKPALNIEKPAMQNSGDSLAYIFGVMQSNGLQQYALQQFNVDEQLLPKFAEGILARVKIDPNDKEQSAYNAGSQVGGQILGMVQSFSKDYYAADEGMSIDPSIVASGLVAALLGQEKMPTDAASQLFQEKMTARQAANMEKLYSGNREAGEKFLEENKTKPGVVTTAIGFIILLAIIPIYRKDHPKKERGQINWGLVGTFTVGIVGSLLMGFGMSKIMVGTPETADMVVELITGVVGLLICVLNYPVYAYIKGNKEN